MLDQARLVLCNGCQRQNMLQSTEINNSAHRNTDMDKKKLQNIVYLINPSTFLLRFYYGQFHWFWVRFNSGLFQAPEDSQSTSVRDNRGFFCNYWLSDPQTYYITYGRATVGSALTNKVISLVQIFVQLFICASNGCVVEVSTAVVGTASLTPS